MVAILSRPQCVNIISEDDDEDSTYCACCQVECKTSAGFYTHSKSVAHIMKASQAGTIERVQENKDEGEYE